MIVYGRGEEDGVDNMGEGKKTVKDHEEDCEGP